MNYKPFTEQEILTLTSLVARGSSTPGVRDDVASFERSRMRRVVLEVMTTMSVAGSDFVYATLGAVGEDSLSVELRARIDEALAELCHEGVLTTNADTDVYVIKSAQTAPGEKLAEAARR